MAVSADNASNISSFINLLPQHPDMRRGSFQPERGHIRCLAHIINIAVQRLLSTIEAQPPVDEMFFEEEDVGRTTGTHAIVKLRQQLEMLRKREIHTEKQMLEQDAIARKNVATNKTG